MAKFCGNCGSQMDDAAKVCGNCGVPFSGSAVQMKYEDPQKKEQERQKMKKVAEKYGIIAAAVIVLIIVIGIIIANTGINGMVKDVTKAHKKFDVDALIEMSSDLYYYADESFVENMFQNVLDAHHDCFEREVGHKYKISYETIETYELSRRNLEEAQDQIADMFPDFDVEIIDKIKIARVEMQVKQGREALNMHMELVFSKENGQWKLLGIR